MRIGVEKHENCRGVARQGYDFKKVLHRLSLTKAGGKHSVEMLAPCALMTDWQEIDPTFLAVMKTVVGPASPNSWRCGALPR